MTTFSKELFQKNTLNDVELQRRLVNIFLEENQTRSLEVEEATLTGDVYVIQKFFHIMKSTCIYLGLEPLSDFATQLEKLVTSENGVEKFKLQKDDFFTQLKIGEQHLLRYLEEI